MAQDDSGVRMWRGPDRARGTLGGLGEQGRRPVALRDGRYLRVMVACYLDTADERGGLLKVSESSFQYQSDPDGRDWIVRYDYMREPGGDPHPAAHVQVRGQLHADVLPKRRPLERVHLPTGRVSLEAVIRLLIEQFEVPPTEPPGVWRAVLSESEQAFQRIAHQPRSGPAE